MFYEQPTVMVARRLLGKMLLRCFDDGEQAVGRIVETEAYTQEDPACHAFRGRTKANGTLFGPPGRAYIHINYGLYYCLNAVTAAEGTAEGVLIRAIEPVENAARLYRNRFGTDIPEQDARKERGISAGPGRLGIALQITRALDGTDLTKADSPIMIATEKEINDDDVVTTTRIGITKGVDLPWRFYVRSSRFVSKR